jgi:hypothetical protein
MRKANKLSATDVHFEAVPLLRDERWIVRVEYGVPTSCPRYRSGNIRADIAILREDGTLLYLVEAKETGSINKESRQFQGYCGTGVGFTYLGGRKVEDHCKTIKLIVTAYYPNPVPESHRPS